MPFKYCLEMDRFVRVPEKLLLEALSICSEISKSIPSSAQSLFGQLQVKLSELKQRSRSDREIETATGKRYFNFRVSIAPFRLVYRWILHPNWLSKCSQMKPGVTPGLRFYLKGCVIYCTYDKFYGRLRPFHVGVTFMFPYSWIVNNHRFPW